MLLLLEGVKSDCRLENYDLPQGFLFENPDVPPIQDDPELEDYNVHERSTALAKAMRETASHYASNNVILPFGSDFRFWNAHINFKASVCCIIGQLTILYRTWRS